MVGTGPAGRARGRHLQIYELLPMAALSTGALLAVNIADSEIRIKGSLCSGTGALDVATPGYPVFVTETNEQAARLLKTRHPDIPNLGDITSIDWALTAWAPPSGQRLDLLTSGDPCQSMSIAGRKLASEDERFLWPDVMRAVDTLRPRQLFLENVQNITSVALIKGADDWRGQKGSVLKLRLDDLREAGYAVRWTVLGACAVGAPHHRHRWFLRARFVGSGAPEAERVISKCGAPRGGDRVLLASPKASDTFGPGVGRVAQGKKPWHDLPTHVALLPTPVARDGGERGAPSIEHAQRRIADPQRSINLEDAVIGNLLSTPRATDGTNGRPNQRGSSGDLAVPSAAQPQNWDRFTQAVALWESILGRPAPEPTILGVKGGRRLNPALSEWMMGYPEGYLTRDFEKNEALRMAGNGVVAHQAQAAWNLLA